MPWIRGRIIRGQIDGRNVLLSEISGVNNKIESAASDKKSVKQLSFVSVAVMYVGAIMGAGFASGREGWQFFGLFGDKAYIGITLSGVLFILFGMMVSYIARKKGTWDLGRIIVPGDSHLLSEIVGWIVALLLYTIIISMSAAGGSLLNQVFSLPRAVGGIIIVVLVMITVFGNFSRLERVFRLIIPILFAIDILCCVLALFANINESGATSGYEPASMAPNWFLAAFIFVSYNILGTIPVIAEASVKSKDMKNGIIGAGLGGFLLMMLTLILIMVLQKDMAYTDRLDLPMLGYAFRISDITGFLFAAVTFAAIYSAASSLYYGFSAKLPENRAKKWIMVAGAVIGFAAGLSGFKTIVAYLYPFMGYIGFFVMALTTANFVVTVKENRKIKNEQ